ncbi:hypothetical protein X777_16458 [Ooceraea biroi]|uniref:Uncharacterized protein n=1 Tax=Ooceraea biroi TaxID=2015173 RepID=A0A026VUM4_OOCBI|nr:hypothetical protein X777_16458 [Ooceraea biroi]
MHYADRRSTIGRRDERDQKYVVDSLPRISGSSLDEGQDIRNLHLPEVAAAPSDFVADLPRIAECWSLRSETTRLSRGSSLLKAKKRRREEVRRATEFKEPRERGALMERETEVARPIESAWDRGMVRERLAAFRSPRESGRTKKMRQRGGGAEETAGAYARVFVYLCGTPENLVDERERKEEEEQEQEEAEEEDARVRRAREGPYPMKGKDEDGGKSQWPTKVCCPFVTRERVLAPAVGTRNCVVGFSVEICVRCNTPVHLFARGHDTSEDVNEY